MDVLKKYFQDPSSQINSNDSIHTLIRAAIRHSDRTFLPKSFPQDDQAVQNYIFQLACRHPDGYKLLINPKTSKIDGIFPKILLLQPMSEGEFTPFMIAVKYQHTECVRFLLDMIDADDNEILTKSSVTFERTVFHICAEFANTKITDYLLKKAELCGTNLALPDIMGKIPLHICAEKNNLYMCEKLLAMARNSKQTRVAEVFHYNDKSTDSNELPEMLTIRNNNGLTAFHLATEKKHFDMVKRMIESVSNPKLLIENRDQQLRTSLHIAALKGRF